MQILPRVHVGAILVVESVKYNAVAALVHLALDGIPKSTDDEDDSGLDIELEGALFELRHHENAEEHGADDVHKHVRLHALGLRPRIDHKPRVANEAIDPVEIRCYLLYESLYGRIARHVYTSYLRKG